MFIGYGLWISFLILAPSNIVQLYSSVPRNIKNPKKIYYFPVVVAWQWREKWEKRERNRGRKKEGG
jgi:hypothetical protein